MTVESLARELGLWGDIQKNITRGAGRKAKRLLAGLAELPVRSSRATRRLGSYVARAGQPSCIRLQFAQEAESLQQTLLHEIAHFCDHQTRLIKSRTLTHGPRWQFWAKTLGIAPEVCGQSAALERLHQERVKLVAVCQSCGTEFHRVRRLNRRRKYTHQGCGGPLRLL